MSMVLRDIPKLMDEPTTGLDGRECRTIMEQIAIQNRRGAAVLMVTHDMELVQEYARRVLVIAQGQILADGPTDRIMTDTALLASAEVLPAQIPQLALRLGEEFAGISTAEEMAFRIMQALERRETRERVGA